MIDADQFPSPAVESPDPAFFIWPVVAVFGANTLLYLYCQIFSNRDNSWIDTMWSLCFVISNATVLILRLATGGDSIYCGECVITARMYLITIPVFIWAFRLSSYIGIRHKSEDYRYKGMREDWEKHGDCAYYVIAYFAVFFGQSLASFSNASSVLFVNIYSKDHGPLFWTDYLGIFIWALGFGIEVLSDRQLANHLANPQPGTGKFIKSGIWRYSRHPNYFGEATMWWGIWLIACSVEHGWITVYAPIGITVCLKYITGVPFPEKKYATNPEFIEYCKETNCFVPWFVKYNYETKLADEEGGVKENSVAPIDIKENAVTPAKLK